MSGEIDELKQKQAALDARLDALSRQLDGVKRLLIGEDRAMTEDDVEAARNIFDRLDAAESDIETLQRDARAAIATADARSDGGNPSKVDIAKRKARNQLVTNAAAARGTKHKIQLSEIQEKVDRVDLAYQTVKDAATKLETDWAALTREKDESGNWVLKLDQQGMVPELAHVVEADLGRDDLAKRLISDNGQGGGST